MTTKRLPFFALAAIASLLLAGCTGNDDGSGGPASDDPGGGAPSGEPGDGSGGSDGGDQPDCESSGSRTTINQAGSSTVLPIAEAWAEEFGPCLNAFIVVGGGGTGTGLSKFCKGELDVADASRPIKETEAAACETAGIEPFEVQVAIDGLSVVVSEDNDFVDCLTVQQLNRIWTADQSKRVYRWSELDPSWPDEEIDLYGPGTDSGTFDYFREVVIRAFDGSTAEMHQDFSSNENDNTLVTGIAESEHGLGYFGLAYFEENQDLLNLVKIDEGKGAGCVEATAANVESGLYSPLSRPLFMYTDGKPTGALNAYFEQALSTYGQDLVEEVGYIRLPAAKLDEMRAKIA